MLSITIKDVAKEAGVSVGTASMALNNKGKINAATRERVFAAADKLGYHPNTHARLLVKRRTRVIGLIITDISNPFFGVIIDSIQEELARHGYDLMLGITKGDIEREQQFIRKFIEMRVDGALVVPSHKQIPSAPHFMSLERQGIPFCFITAYYTNVNAPCVMTDLAEGSYRLTNYLLETGCRKIVYIVANRDIPVSHLRCEGFLRAYREAGYAFSPEWIIISEPSFLGGYNAAEDCLTRLSPDAIMTMNDIMAIGVLQLLKKRNIRVPRDLSVAGYDDLLYSSLLETPLTTVAQPVALMCQKAVDLILKKIEGADKANEIILLEPHLVIRASTAERGLPKES